MKSKLTLSIEREISHRAKKHARKRGRSLSQWVEELLQNEMAGATGVKPKETFSRRWTGRMELSHESDPRRDRLIRKYNLL